jgi:hypothetical protein
MQRHWNQQHLVALEFTGERSCTRGDRFSEHCCSRSNPLVFQEVYQFPQSTAVGGEARSSAEMTFVPGTLDANWAVLMFSERIGTNVAAGALNGNNRFQAGTTNRQAGETCKRRAADAAVRRENCR